MGSVPSGPQGGERAPGGGSEAPPRSVVPEGPTEPRLVSGAEAGGLAEAPRAEGTVEAPVPTARGGSIRRPLALREAPRELQAPRRRLPPEQGVF